MFRVYGVLEMQDCTDPLPMPVGRVLRPGVAEVKGLRV